MMNLRFPLFIVACALIFDSCSTIINGSKQDVTVKASPDQAKIYIDGDLAGTGSAEAKLQRGKEHVIEVKMDGYRTARVTTDKSITGWFWGNLICGGILGGAIDLITGSAYDVDPDKIFVTLESGTGLLNVPANENFDHILVNSPEGQKLASIDVHWQ